jgi:hypothetical protein
MLCKSRDLSDEDLTISGFQKTGREGVRPEAYPILSHVNRNREVEAFRFSFATCELSPCSWEFRVGWPQAV